MYNYLIKIEYDGTKFVGWQYQKNGISIQEKIEKALKRIFKTKTRINGAGRTDKGVHATGQFANFLIKKKIEDKNKFLNSINFFLRKDLISIIKINEKKSSFHARYQAKERIYEYQIVNRLGSLSIDKNKSWHIKKKIDMNYLKKSAKILEGTHNFSTFRSASCSAKSPFKTMNSVKVNKKGDKIFIRFSSKSFLQNQVRSMVGCLEKVACKKWNLLKFKKVFKSGKRNLCAPPAPACGLYLMNVIY
jgi:tRNA pseudouridine38-40 synthase